MGQSKRIRVKIIYNYDIDELPSISQTTVTTSINYINVNLRNMSYNRKVWDYPFSGYEQTFVVQKTGTYKVELWGAKGGGTNGGKGAYTSGKIELTKNEIFYIYVGQNPPFTSGNCYTWNDNAAFNSSNVGGCATGGGATDMRITRGTEWNDTDSLASRIIVAAGGGGALPGYGGYGGAGGGLKGQAGSGYNPDLTGAYAETGGTQTSVNFGTLSGGTTYAGSGYYTGRGGYAGNAGGGSSFISGYKGCIAITAEDDLTPICVEENDPEDQDISCSYHYSGYKFTDGVMIAGNESMTDPNGITVTGHSGNGYARVTLID